MAVFGLEIRRNIVCVITLLLFTCTDSGTTAKIEEQLLCARKISTLPSNFCSPSIQNTVFGTFTSLEIVKSEHPVHTRSNSDQNNVSYTDKNCICYNNKRNSTLFSQTFTQNISTPCLQNDVISTVFDVKSYHMTSEECRGTIRVLAKDVRILYDIYCHSEFVQNNFMYFGVGWTLNFCMVCCTFCTYDCSYTEQVLVDTFPWDPGQPAEYA